MATRTLTKVIVVENDDTTLTGLAQTLEDRVDDAFGDIEARGGEILGPVSIAPTQATVTEYEDGTYRSSTTIEKGVMAVITYRMPVDAD